MRYVSIDIETLGLDPDTCDTIEFGAVIDDMKSPIDKLPRFHCYLPKDNYKGEPYAMAMHRDILLRIAKREEGYQYVPEESLGTCFANWLKSNGAPCTYDESAEEENEFRVEISVAGKNFSGFDMRFLRRIPKFENHIKVHHRGIDPAMFYFDPRSEKGVPSLDACLKLVGLTKEVAHTAIEDALDVIRLIRHRYPVSE